MAEVKPKTIKFKEGEFLSPSEGGDVVRASPTSIVAIAGMARSGKTTLVAGLYELFHKGPFADYLFAWCHTLPGFERRCHLARLCSERESPEMERTLYSEIHELLHLRLADASNGTRHDILFSDIYGEAFRLASDSAEECQKIKIFKRADHVAILVDGKKAVIKKERQGAFTEADSLLRQCLDSGMLGQTSNVQVIVTKWDKIVGRGEEFTEEKLKWLSDRHRRRLATLTTHKTALRSKGTIRAGFGMKELLKKWTVIQNRYSAPPACEDTSYYSEFDRLDSTWPVALRRVSHE
jgi:hypothetical protein